jgi:hypothetical protein
MPPAANTNRGNDQQLLFISQDSRTSRREHLRAIVSHARKTQTKRKYQHKRVSAQRDATYARSLVGWHKNTPDHKAKVPHQQHILLTDQLTMRQPYQHSPTDMKEPRCYVNPSVGMTPSGGLRWDPFASLPFGNDNKDAMELIDFCK